MVRAKIQATQLINRLQRHALGKVDMDASEVSAAKILLDKTIPNLHSTELKSQGGLKLEVNLVGVDRSAHG